MLIDENFDGNCGCPLCRIKKRVDERLTEQYLGEGVMEDHTRTEVNKLGFCAHHYSLLFAFRSKLGLGLQVSTRLNTINKVIEKPTNLKQSKKQAQNVLKLNSTCVVCKYLDEHMVRYYKTVAEVYYNVASFKNRLLQTPGFCLEHYAKLLEYSGYAGSKQKEYANDLYTVMENSLTSLKSGVDEFCNHHDYRQASNQLSQNAKDALKTASAIFYGEENKI
jgi:hypothetical protein